MCMVVAAGFPLQWMLGVPGRMCVLQRRDAAAGKCNALPPALCKVLLELSCSSQLNLSKPETLALYRPAAVGGACAWNAKRDGTLGAGTLPPDLHWAAGHGAHGSHAAQVLAGCPWVQVGWVACMVYRAAAQQIGVSAST